MNAQWPPPRPLLPGHPGPPPPPEAPAGPVPATPLEWVQLVLACLRRRVVWSALAFVAVLGAAVAYQSRKVPEYRVETKILTQAQSLPQGLRQVFDDTPTRSAWELVHQRENLIAIAKRARLLEDPAMVKRLSAARGKGEGKASDPMEALVTILDKSIVVTTMDGTLTIQLDWRDPKQCYDIVSAALQNFLESRRLQEVVAIDDVVQVLERRAAVLRDDYDKAAEQARRRSPNGERIPVASRSRPSAEAVRVASALEAKSRAVRDLEEFRLRRLAEVQSQLDQARSQLSDAHPTITRLRQDVASLSQESPQVTALRAEEAELRRQYTQLAPAAEDPTAIRIAPLPPPRLEEDQAVREARQNYEQITARLNAVLVERDAAKAAFKYRYNVIWPPQLPTEPEGGGWKKVLAAAFVAGLLLAGGIAVAPDLLAGRIVMRWQIERTLGIPVAGELRHK